MMQRVLHAIAGALVITSAPVAVSADAPTLTWPVDCTLGKTCFIEDYVDADPRDGRQGDFACGINSRDGHRGTDIALLSFDDIATGVAVRAAAPGRVANIRDSMPDDRLMRGVTSQNACGNAVLVDHEDGWRTLYCHLRLGSVVVEQGQTVTAGTLLGLVGLSGQTNHPHLHMTVFRGNDVVDPFDPNPDNACGVTDTTLWESAPDYVKTGLITAGFSNRVPSLDDVRSGEARIPLGKQGEPLVVYTHIGHAENGDVLEIRAEGPQGELFKETAVLEDPRVSLMRAFGRKAPADGWPKGEYLGEATLTRDGLVIAHRFAHVTVD